MSLNGGDDTGLKIPFSTQGHADIHVCKPEMLGLKPQPRFPPTTVQHLPEVSQMESCPLVAVYFVKYCPGASSPTVRAISAGEVSARLYANNLNQLAHANAGLDAAVQIAKSIPGFALDSADLAATCALVGVHRR